MEKIYKVRGVFIIEMDYLVKAQDEKEAEWMVKNLDTHGNIIGCDYDQRGLGCVIQKVKEVSDKKAKKLIYDATGYSEKDIENIDFWFVQYDSDKEEFFDDEVADKFADQMADEYLDEVEVEGEGKM